jgi:alkylation response protein AidB-like acyl-CoA dehydrogenase
MTADRELYRAEMREWLQATLPRREVTSALRSSQEVDPDNQVEQRRLQKTVYEAGYLGIGLPKEYGGQGLSSQHQQIWTQESAGYAVPAPGGIATHVTLGIVLPTILAHGSERQKREWIPKMLSGEEIWVQLLSEPGAGSDLAGLLTRATRDGDMWVINGTKIWSSGAMSADFGICLARTDWDAPKHRGLTWFKVPLRDPRVTIRPVREINGGAEFCEEFLDDVLVGEDMVVGDLNAGWPVANTMLAVERGAGSAQSSAALTTPDRRKLAPDLVELAERRGLARDGAVRQSIAKAHINDYVHAQLSKRLARAMMTGKSDMTAASYIKLGTGLLQPQRAATAMEIAGLGGVGWAGDHDPGWTAAVNFLNGRIMSIAGGSNQIQRNIISERILGLPREPTVDSDKPFREVLRDAKKWGTKTS